MTSVTTSGPDGSLTVTTIEDENSPLVVRVSETRVDRSGVVVVDARTLPRHSSQAP
jgi:hypothetical protein